MVKVDKQGFGNSSLNEEVNNFLIGKPEVEVAVEVGGVRNNKPPEAKKKDDTLYF